MVHEHSHSMQVSVWRGSGAEGGYALYTVPERDNQTVLDVVSWIQQELDPSLSYRFACRVGMCGSCAMMVNGVPRWTCRTHVNRVKGQGGFTIAPLRNLPVIRDLVTDMDPFFDKWIKAGGLHQPKARREDPIPLVPPTDPGRVEANQAIECINCAVCYAACDTVAQQPDYLGPAALQRAWTLYNDVKRADRDGLLTGVTGPSGCTACHSQGSCSRFCPNELDPLSAIAGLKRKAAAAYFKRKA